MLARRFLWIIAVLTALVVAGAILYRVFEAQLMRFVMIPKAEFHEAPMPAGTSYSDPAMWLARPDLPDSPAAWAAGRFRPTDEPRASVFFVHPTSFLESTAWNAPLEHQESQWRARLFVRSQASAFNGIAEVWAPKYRQATFGAFLTTSEDAGRALDLAYRDVLAAWEAFLRDAPRDRPIILAGHSQGSLHLMRLMAERIAGRREARRIAAAYVVGWPISMVADLPRLGLPACEGAGQPRCILSWQSFSEPADPKMVTDVYDASAGVGGVPRRGTAMLCVNPLTGNRGDIAGRDLNMGTLIPNADFSAAQLRPGAVPARCTNRGFLLIGDDPPALGPFVLPGNNYHVYDYSLFWANIRADAEARVNAHLGR